MKTAKSFKVGDKVFGKVKGYPAWPAQIVSVNGKRYDVEFYGTKESGCLKPEDIFFYLENKSQFIKPLKRKDYNEAIEQIEKEIEEQGTDGNTEAVPEPVEEKPDVPENKPKPTRSFNIGDKVFGKVKSFPPWPAQIVAVNGKKYDVKFYGTEESGCLKPEDIFYYLENKKQFVKTLKRKDYNDAIEQIEKEIAEAGTDGNTEPTADQQEITEKKPEVAETRRNSSGGKRKRSSSSGTAESQPAKIGKKSLQSEEGGNCEAKEKDVVEQMNDSKEVDGDDNEKGFEKMSASEGGSDEEESREEKQKVLEKNIDKKKEANKRNHEDMNGSDAHIKDGNDEAEETLQNLPPQLENVLLIPDIYLTALTVYAQRVREKEDLFRKTQPDFGTLDDEVDEKKVKVLPVKLKSGEYVGIKFVPRNISDFKSEYERSLDDEKLAKETLELKDKIINSDHDISDNNLIHDLKSCSENDIYQHLQRTVVNYKNAKMKILNVEHELYERVLAIKRSLGLEEAQPKIAIRQLKDVMEMKVLPIMLKKMPHFIDTFRRLRRYVGNIHAWDLSEAEVEAFEENAKTIREMSETIYEKLRGLFDYKDDEKFFEKFQEEYRKFQKETANLTEPQKFTLCAEPYSRKTLLDQIYTELSVDSGNNKMLSPSENEV